MNLSNEPTLPDTDGVKPEALATLSGISGLGTLVRDDELRVRWCDKTYAALCGIPSEYVIGTTLKDLLPAPAAEEREAFLRGVLTSGEARSAVQFGNDKRLLCRVLPIDETAFGYRGLLCMITEGPLTEGATDARNGFTLMRTPCLDDLAVLTKSELRTMYDIACGRSNQDTADRQYRSVRTIENHVESIHKKLRTGTRSALVRLATERGVHGFSAEEWDEIVDGSTETRRAAIPETKRALQAMAADQASDSKPAALN